MKKLTSLLLAFVMLFSLAMPAMAAEGDTYTFYIDISQVAESGKEVSDVRLWVNSSGVANQQMTHVSGSVYSYPLTSSTPVGRISIFYTDGTNSSVSYYFTSTDAAKNLYTPTGEWDGTWGVYSVPVINGSTTGNVTASYTPSNSAKITGLYITVDGVKYDKDNTSEGIPAIVYSDSVVTVTVNGENFANLPEYGNRVSAFVYFGSNSEYLWKDANTWTIDTANNTATFTALNEILSQATAALELKYTNDLGDTMPGSGVYVIYNEGTKPTEPATKTIYFDNTEGWETVYAYAWNDSGNSLGEWPGSAMTKVEGTESIYSIEVPADASNIIFNNGISTQTDDLTIPTDDKNLYTFSTEMWSVYGSTTDPDDPAEITGLYITVDGVTHSRSTAENPVVITPTSEVTITATGTNFSNLTADNMVFYAWGTTISLTTSVVTVNTAATPNTASFNLSGTEFSSLTEAFQIKYNNDALTALNWIATDIYVIYDSGLSEDELPTVTGVELTAGYASYDETSKTYTITPTSGDVTIKITGTNFINLSDANSLNIPGIGGVGLNSELWTIDTENSIATITFSNSRFSNLTTAKEFLFDAGDEAVPLGVYMIYKHTYTVTIDENIANGTATVDPSTYTAGETVTLTVAPADGYQIGTVTVKDAEENIVEFTETGAASGIYKFTMPASAVTVTASFEKLSVTSADIAWGSLAFTYTDGENGAEDGAWTADTADKAGQVTVTNSGSTAFTATPSFADKEDDYGTFSGSFDVAFATLNAGEDKTFTLTLSGAPTKAIPAGTTIGTVTITINKAAEG